MVTESAVCALVRSAVDVERSRSECTEDEGAVRSLGAAAGYLGNANQQLVRRWGIRTYITTS